MAEDNSTVLYDVDGGVARITLNRPEKRNALNEELIDALKNALRRANHDANVRVAIVSGTGDDFCSGADLTSVGSDGHPLSLMRQVGAHTEFTQLAGPRELDRAAAHETHAITWRHQGQQRRRIPP